MSDEAKWSPEPWKRLSNEDMTSSDIHAGDDTGVVAVGVDDTDARRIVACVNACKGLSTEGLEAGALKRAIKVLVRAETFAAGVAIASEVDASEWSLHKGNATVIRDDLYAALCALGRP